MSKQQLTKRIAEVLRKLRTEASFTQDELAEELGINRPAYAAYEEGIARPPYEVVLHLSQLYNLPITTILGHDDAEANATDINAIRINNMINKLSVTQKKAVAKMLDALIN